MWCPWLLVSCWNFLTFSIFVIFLYFQLFWNYNLRKRSCISICSKWNIKIIVSSINCIPIMTYTNIPFLVKIIWSAFQLYIICISVQLVIMVSLSQCLVCKKQSQNVARSENTWKGRTIQAKPLIFILTLICLSW